MKHIGKVLILLMAATYIWLAQTADGFVQFLGYLWGILLFVSLALNWTRASKD
jgi:hypothetical protein